MPQRHPVVNATQEVLTTQGLWLDSWGDLDRVVMKGLSQGAIFEMRLITKREPAVGRSRVRDRKAC